MPVKLGALVVCVTAAFASSAAADYTPDFSKAPSVAEVAAAYPARAKAAGVSGTAMLACRVARDNHPRDCEAVKETPGNYGFGAAARKLAENMVVDTPDMVGKNIFIPMMFDAAVLTGSAMVSKPIWSQMPTIEDVRASFPKTANGVNNVRVVLGCIVGPDGGLSGCSVAQEDPPGQGYGDGALSLASKFRLAPWGEDGAPTVGAHIKLPIRYALTPQKQP
jgi:TonB family protein